MKAAFAGYLGKTMKKKAPQWAAETKDIKKLPKHVKGKSVKSGIAKLAEAKARA